MWYMHTTEYSVIKKRNALLSHRHSTDVHRETLKAHC